MVLFWIVWVFGTPLDRLQLLDFGNLRRLPRLSRERVSVNERPSLFASFLLFSERGIRLATLSVISRLRNWFKEAEVSIWKPRVFLYPILAFKIKNYSFKALTQFKLGIVGEKVQRFRRCCRVSLVFEIYITVCPLSLPIE